MKKVFFIGLVIVSMWSCDPVSDLEANIENLTADTLIVEFVSSIEDLGITLEIAPNEIKLFQEGFDIGSTFLEPSLIEYDSVVVKAAAGQTLKIYKPESPGKNIYNIDEWSASEPSKRFFKYEYELLAEDIE
jgi:hypothetical protein